MNLNCFFTNSVIFALFVLFFKNYRKMQQWISVDRLLMNVLKAIAMFFMFVCFLLLENSFYCKLFVLRLP